MITKFLTSVTTRFSPFSPRSKTARAVLAALPPNARGTIKVNVTQLPRSSPEKAELVLTFKDGKEMNLDLETMKIKDVMWEVDRHSRMLQRKEELSTA